MRLINLALDLIPGTILRYRSKERRADPFAPRTVQDGSDLLIEGFPRSANTYAYYYLQLSFPDILIGHHIHSWQQFLLAKIHRIPSVLVIREPDKCVSSLITKFEKRSIAMAYMEYIIFNALSARFVDKILLFEEVTDHAFLVRFSTEIGEVVGQQPKSVESDQIRKLMKDRTIHKNQETHPLNFDSASIVERALRRMANRVFERIKEQRKDL